MAPGLALVGVAVGAPVPAGNRVNCPTTGPTLITSGNGNFCTAGSIGYKTIGTVSGGGQSDVENVVRETTAMKSAP